MNPRKKIFKKAFTLAEVAITFAVIGIIAGIVIGSMKPRAFTDKILYYSAFNNLKIMNEELAFLDEDNRLIDNNTEYCENLVNIVSTIGATQCTIFNTGTWPAASTFANAGLNFTTPNGQKFYILGYNAGVNPPVTSYREVAVDINGVGTNGAANPNRINQDIVAFRVWTQDGKVVPIGDAQTDTNYLTTNVLQKDGDEWKTLFVGCSYAHGACRIPYEKSKLGEAGIAACGSDNTCRPVDIDVCTGVADVQKCKEESIYRLQLAKPLFMR